jgi:TolA-binding protein
MNRLLKPAFILLLALSAIIGAAQDRTGSTPAVLPFQQNAPTTGNEEQLAIQFYQNRDFENAVDLFEKLYDKKPSYYYYTYYLYSLLELKDYAKAEKLVKTQRKNDNDAPKYLVDLGYISFREGDTEKANKYYEDAIKKMQPDQQQIFDLASAFLTKGENEDAIRVYKKGRELLNNSYPFSFEIASVYERMGNFSGTVEEYIFLINNNPTYLKTVEDRLQTMIANDPDNEKNEILRKSLLSHAQKEPDNPAYAELLWWYSFQQKDFEMALIQAKSLDRRLKENGERLLQLAQIAISNGQYDVAIDAYKYILSKGKNGLYYDLASMELLNTRYLKVTANALPPKPDLEALAAEFRTELDRAGVSSQTLTLIKNLAALDAFYLDDAESASLLLNKALGLPDLTQQARADVKLELGDILLYSGDVWEATLLYQQVYKDFKNDVIGQTAKFKNAKLSFYIGEFKWAQAQVDVLKAATTKFIANDALALSLLISENYDADSGTIGLMLYAKADLLDYKHQEDAAVATLDSIAMLFPGHPITDDMLFKKAEIRLKQGNVKEADSLLTLIYTMFPEDVLADSALMRLAEIKDSVESDKAAAMELYNMLLEKYPGSVYAIDARKRYRILRGDKGF